MATPTRDPDAPWYRVSDEAHKLLIVQTFRAFGSLSEAMARHLGIGRRTLYREVERLGLRATLGLDASDTGPDR